MCTLSPFVYWAQSENSIFIKIDLRDVKNPDVQLKKDNLTFLGKGLGARGVHEYGFHLDFSADIKPEDSTYRVLDNKVDFTIAKSDKGWWSRLTSQPAKPAWLKVDFEKWQSGDPDDDEEDRDVMKDYPGLYEELEKQELGYTRGLLMSLLSFTEDWRKVYLILYNLMMYVGYLYIFIVLILRWLKHGVEAFSGSYADVRAVMVSLQLISYLEIMHPLFGYVPRVNMLSVCMQVVGRSLVVLGLLEPEPRLQAMPVVWYLFVVWSGVEIVRYPFYISQLLHKPNAFLTWLRYTVWIPLYPAGFLCEGVIMLRSLPFLEDSVVPYISHLYQWYEASWPSVTFAALLRVHMLFLMLPGMYTLMAHMYKVRVKKLGGGAKKNTVKKVK